jgi:DNA-binding PucR family transcriptional regulator
VSVVLSAPLERHHAPLVLVEPELDDRWRVLPSHTRARLRDAIIAALDSGRDLADDELGDVEDAVAETVRCGVELSVVLEELALVQTSAWSRWLRRLQQQSDTPARCAAAIAADSVQFLGLAERSRASVIDHYLAEQKAWNASSEALRAQLVQRILAGERVDVDDAAERLGHDLRGRHVAVVVWSPAETARAQAVRAAAIRLARRFGDGADPVVADLEAGICAAWGRLRPGQAGAGVALGEALSPELAAAVGAPREGVDGFRRSLTDAQFARRVRLVRGGASAQITRFEEVAVLALLTSDVAEAQRFVADVLGSLAAPAAAARRAAETLRAYYEVGASLTAAARVLGVHPNTVVNRLRHAADLLGYPVDERSHEVWTALRLDDLLCGGGGRSA